MSEKIRVSSAFKTIEKIISGGQTEADRAGLDAARTAGIPTGGTAPKGWRITDWDGNDASDSTLEGLGLVEAKTSAYPPRTRQNVKDSDGTILFGYMESGGCRLTIEACKKEGKPYICNPTVKEFLQWIDDRQIAILNVAGNRHSAYNPDIYQDVYDFLIKAFKHEKTRQEIWKTCDEALANSITSFYSDDLDEEEEDCEIP